MEKIEKGHLLSQSPDYIKANIELLKSLFPNIVKEGKIDKEELLSLFEEEFEPGEEYYRFTWAGKSQARQEANKPSTGTLRPVKEDSKEWDITQNVLIEGDNLEVLKILQKSYANKVKLIYIDPPYNTGNDFIYKDDYSDNLSNYLALTGQIDESGKKLSTNPESDGRFHSNWLNMMYPRLKLARNLLKDDGVIFISIDENEIQNLKKLCDEIFGESNFRGLISRSTGTRMGSGNKRISSDLDYLVVFSNSDLFNFFALPMTESDLDIYDQEDENGKYLIRSLRRTGGENRREDRPTMFYSVQSPDGTNVYPIAPEGWESRWVCSEETYHKLLDDGLIEWKKVKKGHEEKWQVYQKHYLGDSIKYPSNSWTDIEGNKKATRELNELFDGVKLFDHPKPIDLMNKIIKISMTNIANDEIVLDFFAGSGTLAHSVFALNAKDNARRKFICVQIPEPTKPESQAYKAGYKTIAEITKERLRRAGEKVKLAIKDDLFTKEGKSLDIGFRVFRLDSSNINAWDGNVQDLERNLLSAAENIKPERTEEDVLYEILLKSGLDLTQSIEEKIIADKKVFNVGFGALFICLANDLTTKVAEGIGKWKLELEPVICRAIFKDTGFNDVEKTNSIQILKRYGINEVNTI